MDKYVLFSIRVPLKALKSLKVNEDLQGNAKKIIQMDDLETQCQRMNGVLKHTNGKPKKLK